MPTESLVLPFSVPSANRKEPFPKEMEAATAYCLAELERQKGGGIIMKQPPERIAFVAEARYRLWLVPWNDQTLVFDGLGTIAHGYTYRPVPNVRPFIRNLETRSKTLETHLSFLSDNINYFQAPTSEKNVTLNGLIADPEFLADVGSYLSEAKPDAEPPHESSALSPALDESALTSVTAELDNLLSAFRDDLTELYAGMKLLNKISNNFVKTIKSDIKAVEDDYAEQIRKEEEVVAPKVERLREEYDKQTTELTRSFEKQLQPLQKERVKLQKTEEQTLAKIEHYKVEAKTASAAKNAVSERKWKEKISETKKQLSEVRAQIKDAGARIRETEDKRTAEAFNLRSESEARINEARKDILELESMRDAKTQALKQQMTTLRELTTGIVEQMNAKAKSRETNIAELEKLGIRQNRRDIGLVQVPFYMLCFRSERRKRYVVIPPSVVNSVGFTIKLKGALGRTKVRQALEPRFKAISSFLNRLPRIIEQNAVLEREVYVSGEKADGLKTPSTREQLRNGLDMLKQEGWISEKEHAALTGGLSEKPAA